ncbi:MAG: carboxypeptidase regulatory-like domain-containing protein [Bradymonadales bacterium]|nr:carboxypeptidase regulatory-like domain-containing protein [Bradymonadales bacterium]
MEEKKLVHTMKDQLRKPWTIFLIGCLAGVLLSVGGSWLIFRVWSPFGGPGSSGTADGPLQAISHLPEESLDRARTFPVHLPYSIRGLVTDRNGDPLAAVRITASSELVESPLVTTTDETGRFTISNTPVGLYTLQAQAVGHATAIRQGIAPDGPTVRFMLEPVEGMSGWVVHDGVGVSGIRLFVGGPGLFPPLTTVTGEDGSFFVEGLSAISHLEVVGLGEHLGSGFGQLFSVSGQEPIQLQLQPALPLVIEVHDALTGESVSQGLFTVSANALRFVAVSAEILGGVGRMDGLPPGSLYLRVIAAGYLPWEGAIDHDGSLHQVSLQPGGVLMGRVIDDRGAPVVGARLQVTAHDAIGRRWRFSNSSLQVVERLMGVDGRPLWAPRPDLSTGPEGRFQLGGLPPGQVSIQVEAEGYRSVTVDSLQMEENQTISGIEIRLLPAAP